MADNTDLARSDQSGCRWVLGLDSGGTKAIGLLVREDGTAAGVGFGGPTNQYFVSAGDALVSLRRVFRQALDIAEGRGYKLSQTEAQAAEESGVTPRAEVEPPEAPSRDLEDSPRRVLAAAYFSAPGLSKEVAQAALLERFVPDRFVLADDAQAAFAGALPAGEGVIALAGTGSFAYARCGDQVAVKGGWGPLLGDEGSGYWIALEAIKAVIRAYERRAEPTSLEAALRATLRYSFPEELRRRIYSAEMTRQRLSGLAMLVSQEAAAGDRVAQGILRRAGAELGALAVSATQELRWPNRFAVSLTGGVARAGSWVQESFRQTIEQALPRAIWTEPVYAPCVGAVLLALQQIGVRPTAAVLQRLEKSLMDGFRPFLPMLFLSGAAERLGVDVGLPLAKDDGPRLARTKTEDDDRGLTGAEAQGDDRGLGLAGAQTQDGGTGLASADTRDDDTGLASAGPAGTQTPGSAAGTGGTPAGESRTDQADTPAAGVAQGGGV